MRKALFYKGFNRSGFSIVPCRGMENKPDFVTKPVKNLIVFRVFFEFFMPQTYVFDAI